MEKSVALECARFTRQAAPSHCISHKLRGGWNPCPAATAQAGPPSAQPRVAGSCVLQAVPTCKQQWPKQQPRQHPGSIQAATMQLPARHGRQAPSTSAYASTPGQACTHMQRTGNGPSCVSQLQPALCARSLLIRPATSPASTPSCCFHASLQLCEQQLHFCPARRLLLPAPGARGGGGASHATLCVPTQGSCRLSCLHKCC